MKIPILVYVILFLGSFLIGSLGVAPVLEIGSTWGKIPYMILIVVGYIVLTVFFISWYRGDLDRIIHQYFKKRQGDSFEEDEVLEKVPSEVEESMELSKMEDTIEEPTEKMEGEKRERGTI